MSLGGLARRYWSALAGAPFWLYAGGAAPCPEGKPLKALRPVFRQVPTPGCQSDTGRRCRKPNRKTNHMQTLIEQPADSAGAILSGLAIQAGAGNDSPAPPQTQERGIGRNRAERDDCDREDCFEDDEPDLGSLDCHHSPFALAQPDADTSVHQMHRVAWQSSTTPERSRSAKRRGSRCSSVTATSFGPSRRRRG